MATSTVSSVTGDVWQLITSVTASGTSVSFSSLSGYKTLMIAFQKITTGATATLSFQLNTDTTNNYSGGNAASTENAIIVAGNTSSTRSGLAIIYDADKAIPHKIESATGASNAANLQAFLEPAAITSIEAKAGGQTFTGGTIAVYGIAS
jgi:hypothetical protein